MDVNEIGGTAMLGISRPVVKAHGSSDARAIRSAVRQAIAFAEAGVIQAIEENIESMKITAEEGEKQMVYEKIVEKICTQFGLDPEAVNENTSFVDDLGADSLDVVELTIEMEEEFGMAEVPEEELKKLRTVGDLVEYVKTHTDV